ncbi:cytochrome P450 [Cunninghamella echinulata]|nr:cytochrome P450 [Cunninghamella echinulata]
MSSLRKSQNSYLQTAGIAAGAAAAVLGVLAYKYPNRLVFTEDREDIPSFDALPLVGITPRIVTNMNRVQNYFLEALERNHVLTGTGNGIGFDRSIVTCDPRNVEYVLKGNFENYVKSPQLNEIASKLFGHGIFNANGEHWKYQRKTASQIFNVKNFRDHFTAVFVEHIHYMTKNMFDVAANNGTTLDFHDIMFRFTLDSFVKLSFGVDLNSLSTKGKIPFANSFDTVQSIAFVRFCNPFYKVTEKIGEILQPWKTTFNQHVKIIDDFAYDVIRQRRKEIDNGEEFNDLLSRFMVGKNEYGQPLSDEELRDVVLNMVIAGRDTTAQALSWTFLSLMENPEAEEKLVAEILSNLPEDLENDPAALYEAIKNMKYAHAVFYEVLRLYPSVPNNQKYALNDDVWPDGSRIKKGDTIYWSPWAQGRSEHIWGPDAKQFKPERWFNEEGELIRETQGKWPAFHGGPRVCLGQNLATLEALVAITSLLRRYKFTMAPNQNVTYQASFTLPMKSGLHVYVEHRN